jgi:hypothetical protein
MVHPFVGGRGVAGIGDADGVVGEKLDLCKKNTLSSEKKSFIRFFDTFRRTMSMWALTGKKKS